MLAAAFVGLGLLRITSTYAIFNQAWDEPAHLATGMEWLDDGRYTREPLHPPLARVMTAVGPYIAGMRSAGHQDTWLEGNSLLYGNGRYRHNLTLARLGTLPFFVLGAAVVFLWARHSFGAPAGVLGVLVFTMLPPVLGHAGLATTDTALAVTVSLALYLAWRWLEHPTVGRSAGLGAALGIALLTKLSALLFLPAGIAGLALSHRLAGGAGPARARRHTRLHAARVAYVLLLLTVWAGYRFSVGPLIPAQAPASLNHPEPSSPDERAYRLAEAVARAPIYPAPEFFQGLSMLYRKNQAGQKAYLLGEVRSDGWWYFFPVALAVKTPLALLLLLAAVVAMLARDPDRPRRWRRAAPLVAALAILLVCLPSRINIGVRHVLPLYPLACVAAAGWVGMAAAAGRRRPARVVFAITMVGWLVISSARAHPDYIAYFNELAGFSRQPVLVDSDLDNGMDLQRLADTLRELGVPDISIAYAGTADLERHGLPPYRLLAPRRPVTGWVAASVYSIKLGAVDSETHDEFAWLEAHSPVATVGRSILLYDIPQQGPRAGP